MCSSSYTGVTTMPGSVFRKGLRDARRGLIWWAIGIAAYVGLIASVWPSVRDNPSLKKLTESYPEALKAFVSFGDQLNFGTASGYLGAELFSFMVPLLLLIAGIGAGARAVAAEEEAGTLDLLLAHPVSRTRVALEKLAVVVLQLLALGTILWLSLWISAMAFNMDVSGLHLLAAVTSSVLLALAFGALAAIIGAATGRHGVAITACASLALASYLVNAPAPLVHGLDKIRWISPWYHYAAGDPLRKGLAVDHSLVLATLFVAAAIIVPVVFRRRDLA